MCSSLLIMSTTDLGLTWRYRSRLGWVPAMGQRVSGPDEGAVSLLPDGMLLAVYRVQEHRNYWQSTSSDGGVTLGAGAGTTGRGGVAQQRIAAV